MTVRWPDSVVVSSLMLSVCLLVGLPSALELAFSDPYGFVEVSPGVELQHGLAEKGFALLTAISVGLLVIWTGYRRKDLWAWFALLLLVGLYFFPVHVLPILLGIAKAEEFSWSEFLSNAIRERGIARTSALALLYFLVMVIALLIPVSAFFRKSRP